MYQLDVAVPADHFRATMSRFCSGVVAVAGLVDDKPVGMTCQSFISLSLDPPLVTFAPAHTSTSYPSLRVADRIGISVLSERQADIAVALSRKGVDKFADVSWHLRPSGALLIDDALAWMDCTIEAEYDAGDHLLVVARVQDLGYQEHGLPLTYFRSSFNAVG